MTHQSLYTDRRRRRPDVSRAAPGDSVMETAVRNGVPGIVGECGGCLSCATCHVFVDEADLRPRRRPGEIEDEMLDGTAVDREDNSRLSCQIKLQDGLRLPRHHPGEQL